MIVSPFLIFLYFSVAALVSTVFLPDLIHSIKTNDPSGIEAYWHKRFEAKRMQGEWFNLSSADIKAFKRWRRIA